MIRVNLLKPRRGHRKDPQSVWLTPGRSAFISGREVLIAVTLLLIGAAMLHLNYGLADLEQAGAAENLASTVSAGADGSESESDLQSAGATSIDGDEGSTEEEPPFTVPPNEASSDLVASPTPEQKALAKAREDAAVWPPATLQQSGASPSPPPGAPRLRDILITERGGALRLTLVTGERSTYETFRLEDPDRVVVDLPGAWITLPAARLRQEISHPLVHRIRLGQYKADPPISRLVLDVEGFPNLLIFPHSSGLDIQVSNTAQ